ncbi:MAG: hypothetical protein DMF78_07250 [Acidobacteria bacterium]|nr:MAG: hypothetical protein DMF78_07250 [Acidobacteriota bacterium]
MKKMGWDVSRRVFLKGAGLAVLGIGTQPSSLIVRAAEGAPVGGRIFVHLFLRGGADPLNMVVPYGDHEYYDARGEIAIPPPGKPGGAVALDDHFGFHPGLAPLKPLYADGRLAIVYGVGNYSVTRSHFSAQDFAELGTPGVRTTTTGTLARMVGSLPGSGVTKAVSFSSQSPVSLLGPDEALVALKLKAFRLRAKNWQSEAERRVKAMYTGTPLSRLGDDLFDALGIVQTVLERSGEPASGIVYPDSPIGNAMRQAAQVIKAGVGTRCIFCGVSGVGDYDSHARQLERNTVAVNGSMGSDHGTGYLALVLGGGVKGGRIHGQWPGLAKHQLYEERDLAVTTDFRDLFAEVAGKHLGLSPTSTLFPGYTPASVPGILA